MSWSPLRALGVLGVLIVSGCISSPPAETDPVPDYLLDDGRIDHQAILETIGVPFEVEHDHRDPTHPDHRGGLNLELVAWNTLDVTLGENGYANFVFYEDDDEDLAFVAIDGDDRAGFTIVDTSDPLNITALGHYRMNGRSVQEVRVFPDGDYALMNVQALPSASPATLTGANTADAGPDCTVCLHLVDVRDRTNPTWVAALPVDNIGTHNMDIHTIDGTDHVFYVGQPASYEHPTNLPGNYIGVAQIIDTPQGKAFAKTGQWRDPQVSAIDEGRSFPHDVMVYEHPLTGAHIGYLSYWDGGAVTVDFSNPQNPQTLDVNREIGPSGILSVHWFAPEPTPRADGHLIAWSAPEIGQLDSDAGAIRAYDVTDPSTVEYLGAWMVPHTYIPGAYVFSGHTTVPDLERGLLAVSHYHAGVWILDLTDPANPEALGYYVPNGGLEGPHEGDIWWKKPNFNPEGYLPNVYQARWKDDLLWVTERGTGMYVLDYTGPIPGSVLAPQPSTDGVAAASTA